MRDEDVENGIKTRRSELKGKKKLASLEEGRRLIQCDGDSDRSLSGKSRFGVGSGLFLDPPFDLRDFHRAVGHRAGSCAKQCQRRPEF